MADIGYVRSLLSGVEDRTLQSVLVQVFEHVLDNMRHGPVAHQTRAENFQAYYLNSTTATSTGEFNVAHGLGYAPQTLIQVLDLTQPGARQIPLEVSRAADGVRVYLKSTSTSAPFSVMVESFLLAIALPFSLCVGALVAYA